MLLLPLFGFLEKGGLVRLSGKCGRGTSQVGDFLNEGVFLRGQGFEAVFETRVEGLEFCTKKKEKLMLTATIRISQAVGDVARELGFMGQ
jgi:hypothetical protein